MGKKTVWYPNYGGSRIILILGWDDTLFVEKKRYMPQRLMILCEISPKFRLKKIVTYDKINGLISL